MNRLLLLLAGLCGPARAAAPTHAFTPVPLPTTGAAKREVQVSPSAVWAGAEVPLAYSPLVQAGRPIGDSLPFSQLVDFEGQPIDNPDGSPRVCNGLDGATLLTSGGALYSVVHGECQPGVIQLSRLRQDAQSGQLSVVSTAKVDLAPMGGGNLFCAGEVSPWGSHLAAEEFEVDAAKINEDGTVSDNYQLYNHMARYHGGLQTTSPYQFGWIDELTVAGGEGTIQKRLAMGRFSHEQARVMPDARTVYLSDDATNGAFFMFLADVPGDLSAGTLYASRWSQVEGQESFGLSWISLGHATDAEITKLMAEPPAFADLIEVDAAAACPEGMRRVRTAHEKRCIRVRPGRIQAASRLESRRVAALRGATTELRKWEGMALDPGKRRLYVAVSEVTRGMTSADPDWDLPSVDHIRMAKNRCGMVMALDVGPDLVQDTAGQPIDSGWVLQRAAPWLSGQPISPDREGEHPTCAVGSIANPDNLAFIPEAGMLLIAEDTHGHENNVLWAADVARGTLTRILVAPETAEVAGLNWFPNLGGWSYLTVTIQFPDEDWWQEGDPEEVPMSTSGVVGPFPVR